MNTNILKIAEQYPQISLTVRAADLVEFGRALIANATEALKTVPPEEYLSRNEVAMLFNTTTQTIYRWGKRGYLRPVMVGGAVRYRRSDCELILNSKTHV